MAKAIKWRYAYDGLGDEVSDATALDTGDETPVVQSAAEDADINNIVRRFGLTGQAPQFNREPFYGDFTEVPDFQSALDRMREAERSFNDLSADVRRRFDNEPAKLWEYLHSEFDEKKLAEARELGLVDREEAPPAPMRVEVANFPQPPQAAPGA